MKHAVLIPYTFVLMNWAVVVGLYYFISGRKDVWRKDRASDLGSARELAR